MPLKILVVTILCTALAGCSPRVSGAQAGKAILDAHVGCSHGGSPSQITRARGDVFVYC